MDKELQQLSEVLDITTTKVPQMIRELIGTLYSAKAGEDMGKAVGSFYKNLVEAGIPAEDALSMSKDYMLSLRSVMDAVKSK